MTKNNKIFRQVTSVEHWDDNDATFNALIKSVKEGNAKDAVVEMRGWPQSDLDPIPYDEILRLADECNETIVYDDFHYLLAANEDIIVLYERI